MTFGHVSSHFTRILGLFVMAAAIGMAAAPTLVGADEEPVFQGFPPLQGFGGPADQGEELTISAYFSVDGQKGRLYVIAEMGPDWHVYSLDQPKGGPMKSQVNPVSSSDFKITGTFLPNKNAHIVPATLFPVDSHEHSEQVTWSAPIELAAGVDAKTLEIHGDLDGQVCSDINGSCIPFIALPTKFVARLASAKKSDQPINVAPTKVAAEPKKPAAKLLDLGSYTLPSKLATITGHLASKTIAPGESTSLLLTITPADHWHTYRYEDAVPDGVISKPTLIVFSERSGLEVGRPTTPAKVITVDPIFDGGTPEFYYDGPVTFTIKVTAPADAKPGSYRLNGNIGMMVCTDGNCDFPTAFMFQVDVPVAAKAT